MGSLAVAIVVNGGIIPPRTGSKNAALADGACRSALTALLPSVRLHMLTPVIRFYVLATVVLMTVACGSDEAPGTGVVPTPEMPTPAAGLSDTEEFRAWATLAIAIVALILPGAIWAWSTYWRKGTVDVHETFTIEVGFSSYGPTIGMNGTLRAVHHDLFIRSIDLVVTKMKDSSRYAFEWLLF